MQLILLKNNLTYLFNLCILYLYNLCMEVKENMNKKLMNISTAMMLLNLLEEQDMYGYQMIRELEVRSENVFSLKEGTLYPILHGLETEGAVESFEKIAETGRMRKYYHITKAGRKVLADKKAEWDLYQRAVNNVIGGNAYGKAATCIQ